MVKLPWYILDMREIPVSKFKATCLATLAEVERTRTPVRVTRFGKPVAEIVPPKKKGGKKKSWLGCLEGQTEILGDLIDTRDLYGDWGK
jgi:antitoxin (DNA-binding transcriptional repressor) of toxin-antitoxin stability system